jgi:hypothetical protein
MFALRGLVMSPSEGLESGELKEDVGIMFSVFKGLYERVVVGGDGDGRAAIARFHLAGGARLRVLGMVLSVGVLQAFVLCQVIVGLGIIPGNLCERLIGGCQ